MYKHSYNDWLHGMLTYTDVFSNWRYDKNYISPGDKEKIELKQKEIFDRVFEDRFDNRKRLLIRNFRSSSNRESEILKHVKTFENILHGRIEDFEDTTVIDEEDFMNAPPLKRKIIPPLNETRHDEVDLQFIQEAIKEHLQIGEWNYQKVQTADSGELFNHMDFYGEFYARFYYELIRYLRNAKDAPFNSFSTKSVNYEGIGLIRAGLKNAQYISPNVSPRDFLRIFSGSFLLDNERIDWLGSYDALNYFLYQLKPKLTYSENHKFYGTASICFSKKAGPVNPDTLRKAKKLKPEAEKELSQIIEKARLR